MRFTIGFERLCRTSVLLCLVALSSAFDSPPIFAQSDLPIGYVSGIRPGMFPDHTLYRSPFRSATFNADDCDAEKYLLGDWCGLRRRMVDAGFKPSVILISDPFWNTTGGLDTGFGEYDLLIADLFIDSNKVFGWKGGTFRVGFSNNSGRNVSTEYIGNNFAVQTAASGTIDYRLTYLSWTQSLANDRLSFSVGRLTINDLYGEEFLGSEYFKAFESVGFTLVPEGPFFNAPGAFGYPTATWGARLKYEPVETFYVQAGVYNGEPDVKKTNRHGVDMSMSGPAFAIAEMGWRHDFCSNGCGMPGNIKIGAFYNGGDFDVFDADLRGTPGAAKRGLGGYYAIVDQTLLRWGASKDKRHLGGFVSFAAAPDQSISLLPYFFNTGILAYGLFASRPQDYCGVGFIYGSYSGDLRNQAQANAVTDANAAILTTEMTIEYTYSYQLFPGLWLQPDIQHIIHPGGNEAIPNALAVGIGIKALF